MNLNYYLFLILLIFSYSIRAQTGFSIQGELENAEGLKVYLTQRGDALILGTETPLLDSTVVRNGLFKFTGAVEEPNYYAIFVGDKKGWKTFILENKAYQITGDADKIWEAKIEGSEEIQIYKEYATQVNPLIEKLNAASDSSQLMFARGDTTLGKMYGEQNVFYSKQMVVLARDFILKYPDSYTSLFLFRGLDKVYNKEERRQVYEKLSDRVKQHAFAKTLYYELYKLDDLIALGKQTIPFSLQDQFGNTVALNDYKGKYVLIDFWASWCGPCRAEHSYMIKLYELYQSKGLEILGVSLDKNPENWKRVIEEDELPWRNVLDLQDGKNEIAAQYGVKALPSNFLLDRNGVLIATNLRYEAMAEKLQELFGK